MVLYISNSVDYSIFNRLFSEGKISAANQMQKFNNSIINGLSNYDSVVSLSALPYLNVSAPKIDAVIGNVRNICIKNKIGRLHKASNITNLIKEGIRIIKEKRPDYILCDAVALAPCYSSLILGALFKIPVIGIITDLPGMLKDPKSETYGIKRLQHFSGYVLLTKQMNALVNPKNKPYMVMEGICPPTVPDIDENMSQEKVILYTGALWKNDAGIEYMVKGFLESSFKDYELHFYGVGELVPWLTEINKEYPNVKYMGCVTNDRVVELQCRSSVLVNPRPSKQAFCKYSFPSKTIEYMVSGTPVLMTKLIGVPEEYFDYVYLIKDETPEGARAAIEEMLAISSKERMKKGRSARNFVISEKNCLKQSKKILDFCTTVKR